MSVSGYCMGAGLALRTAGADPDRVAAAAGFHGAFLATDAPDCPRLLADRITAELYFGHADQDSTNPADQIARLDKTLTAAGVRPRAEATDRHWAALLELLGRTL
jgi:carboxymethylenebutenolidase